jgi:hypothetical protein
MDDVLLMNSLSSRPDSVFCGLPNFPQKFSKSLPRKPTVIHPNHPAPPIKPAKEPLEPIQRKLELTERFDFLIEQSLEISTTEAFETILPTLFHPVLSKPIYFWESIPSVRQFHSATLKRDVPISVASRQRYAS